MDIGVDTGEGAAGIAAAGGGWVAGGACAHPVAARSSPIAVNRFQKSRMATEWAFCPAGQADLVTFWDAIVGIVSAASRFFAPRTQIFVKNRL